MEQNDLKQTLADWTDIDLAQYQLAICLGIIKSDLPFGAVKYVFWTNNAVGNALAKILDTLAGANVLEKRDEPDY